MFVGTLIVRSETLPLDSKIFSWPFLYVINVFDRHHPWFLFLAVVSEALGALLLYFLISFLSSPGHPHPPPPPLPPRWLFTRPRNVVVLPVVLSRKQTLANWLVKTGLYSPCTHVCNALRRDCMLILRQLRNTFYLMKTSQEKESLSTDIVNVFQNIRPSGLF